MYDRQYSMVLMSAPCRIGTFIVRTLVLSGLFWIAATEPDWVDPDTPDFSRSTTAFTVGDDRHYRLVFSDEFQQDGRTFHDGHDPRWTALDKNDATNNPLHYYSHDAVTTSNGVLNLTIDAKPKDFPMGENKTERKNFQSGMLQSWNKFCFTGGILEVSVKLPGDPRIGGLWPAVWMMGNLARATFIKSTERLWPYSTNVCDDRTRFGQQEINSCTSKLGRGAPEIDLLETMYMRSWPAPVLSTSLQVAPGIEKHRPKAGHAPNATQVWYPDIQYGRETKASLNTYFYGARFWENDMESYQTDAISTNMLLNSSHFFHQHLYRVEWEPPSKHDDGYIRWYVDGKLVSGIPGESLRVSGTEIPSEPMYLLMNLAVSKDWAMPDAYFLNCKCKCYDCGNPCCRSCALPEGFCENLPASLEIDFVRVYQAAEESKHTLGCSPKSRPTKHFIESHLDRYKLPDQTRPLLPIMKGGGSCQHDHDCGGYAGRGTCMSTLRNHTCECSLLWTGPTCLAHAARSPISLWRVGVGVGLACGSVVLMILVVLALKTLATKTSKHAQHHNYSKLSEAQVSNGHSINGYTNGGSLAMTNGHHVDTYQRDAPSTNGNNYRSHLPRVDEEKLPTKS